MGVAVMAFDCRRTTSGEWSTKTATGASRHLLTHPSIWAAAAVPDPDPDPGPGKYLSEKICAAVVFSKSLVTLSESKAYLDERGVAGHARPDVLVPMWRCPQRRWQGR